MKRFLKLRYLFIGGLSLVVVTAGLAFQDSYRKNGNFRTMQDPISSTESVDLTGLRELQFMGGPLMPLPELKKRFDHIKEPIIIVDGIRGKYGYVDGIPENYLAYKQASPPWKSYLWRLFYTGAFQSDPARIVSAETAVKFYGFDYRSFRIGSKYLSRDENVDKFISFLDTVPEYVCLYFCCMHGKGRTSVMLVMADIMKNAPKVSLKDIIKRQYLLGSVDLFDTTPWTRGAYATKTLEDRKKFIEHFYKFICQRKTGGIQHWSEWNRGKKEG